MQDILKIMAGVAGGILMLDVFGFFAWIFSGQVPVDGFYLGAITTNILKIILF